MPAGLLDILEAEELLDLMAFVLSGVGEAAELRVPVQLLPNPVPHLPDLEQLLVTPRGD